MVIKSVVPVFIIKYAKAYFCTFIYNLKFNQKHLKKLNVFELLKIYRVQQKTRASIKFNTNKKAKSYYLKFPPPLKTIKTHYYRANFVFLFYTCTKSI